MQYLFKNALTKEYSTVDNRHQLYLSRLSKMKLFQYQMHSTADFKISLEKIITWTVDLCENFKNLPSALP